MKYKKLELLFDDNGSVIISEMSKQIRGVVLTAGGKDCWFLRVVFKKSNNE